MTTLQANVAASATNTTLVLNPLLQATMETFSTMMDCNIKRKGLNIQTPETPFYNITAVISLTGRIVGTVCISFPTDTALATVKKIIEMEETEITPIVCDCVGEFANMIAGGAKNRLHELKLELGIPNIVRGEEHHIDFPSKSQPMCVHFDSDIGPFMIAFGFVEKN